MAKDTAEQAEKEEAVFTSGTIIVLAVGPHRTIEPGNSLSKERSDKLMYGCTLDPDRINRQAYSKIIIDLVDQVARFRRLCK